MGKQEKLRKERMRLVDGSYDGRPAQAARTARVWTYWVSYYFKNPDGSQGFDGIEAPGDGPIVSGEQVVAIAHAIADKYKATGADGTPIIGLPSTTITIMNFTLLRHD